ncbi:hypothetical protein [Levilactobacillus cerevisiae]|uniref:hypothetical protein n=1 Tax=Levilactobacillus cerevisiae TaxID=1704076 RepID=UPI000F77885F|nr:hypothetical protein [Levilactobacillus cerevisiae]
MSIKLTLANNQVLTIDQDTPLKAWKGTHDKNEETGNREYYAESLFDGTLLADTALTPADLLVALQGFLSHTDWFAVGPDFKEVFQSASVVSLAN